MNKKLLTIDEKNTLLHGDLILKIAYCLLLKKAKLFFLIRKNLIISGT
ncbi:hypothetical protein GA0061082_10425 [Snodgrassella sp. R-53583]|nr:hypothetical protein GA0061082_10425 [Snodgrassella sp. R-53583]